MNIFQPVYTEDNDCQDCYKCIRECVSKAIKIENSRAKIVYDRCTFCGHCTTICPRDAKKVRNDLKSVKQLLKYKDKVIVSLAPSFISEFPQTEHGLLCAALKKLGFYGVSETAVGAEIVSLNIRKFLENEKKGVFISSACTAAVEYVKKYKPDLTDCIIPFDSPVIAHAKYIKKFYGQDTAVVFIGPCVAKKYESDTNKSVLECVLTFRDLIKWFNEEGIDVSHIQEQEEFIPVKASEGRYYPIEGGMLKGIADNPQYTDINFTSISGMKNIKDSLDNIEVKEDSKLFLELLGCEGGCINGPGSVVSDSRILKREHIIKASGSRHDSEKNLPDIKRKFISEPVADRRYSEDEIRKALTLVGKRSEADEINCGGCGYSTCRNFGIAILEGRAEPTMCASYMRNLAGQKSSALIQKMPSGVVIVNDKLEIVESNRNFSRIIGGDTEILYDLTPGLTGADIRKIAPFYKLFASLLQTGEKNLEKDVSYNSKLIHLSLFTIQENKIVGAILMDLDRPDLLKGEVVKRAEQVIDENLETVQKIAYLLGENASKTQASLSSIIKVLKSSGNE